MAKRDHIPRQAQQMYSRPSKGYQQNMMKSMADMTPPEMPDNKKLRIQHIFVAIILIVFMYLLITQVRWWLFFIPILIGAAYLIFISRYMNRKQMELLAFYQRNRMSKEMFVKQLKRTNKDMKQENLDQYSKMWDIVAGRYTGKFSFFEKLFGLNVKLDPQATQPKKVK